MVQKDVAFQCATDASIAINAFYGTNSHFLLFSENLSQSLMEKNVKFVLNDVKATAFSGSKRRNTRASIRWRRKATLHVTLHNDVYNTLTLT